MLLLILKFFLGVALVFTIGYIPGYYVNKSFYKEAKGKKKRKMQLFH